MAIKHTITSLRRFLKNILKHPGSWILASLIVLGVAFAMPALASGFVIAAFVCTGMAFPLLIFQALDFYRTGTLKKMLGDFIEAHPVQFGVILLGLLLLFVALVFTIGFFTGGAAFTFMAPVFAAIAAPFATAATSWGISLCLPALAGCYFIIAALNLPNTLKRFLGWLDSFKYDQAMANEDDMKTQKGIQWTDKEVKKEKVATLLAAKGYPKAVVFGVGTVIANGFFSPYADQFEAAEEALAAEAAKGNKYGPIA